MTTNLIKIQNLKPAASNLSTWPFIHQKNGTLLARTYKNGAVKGSYICSNKLHIIDAFKHHKTKVPLIRISTHDLLPWDLEIDVPMDDFINGSELFNQLQTFFEKAHLSNTVFLNKKFQQFLPIFVYENSRIMSPSYMRIFDQFNQLIPTDQWVSLRDYSRGIQKLQ